MSTIVGNAADRVYESMQLDFERHTQLVCEALAAECESPIEVMVGAVLVIFFTLNRKQSFAVIFPDGKREGAADANVELHIQFKWNNYRSDFALRLRGLTVLIECDGHEFHERTKDQAERDRRKDREAQEQGFHILRFTGSEIYRSPQDCVRQVLNFCSAAVAKQ